MDWDIWVKWCSNIRAMFLRWKCVHYCCTVAIMRSNELLIRMPRARHSNGVDIFERTWTKIKLLFNNFPVSFTPDNAACLLQSAPGSLVSVTASCSDALYGHSQKPKFHHKSDNDSKINFSPSQNFQLHSYTLSVGFFWLCVTVKLEILRWWKIDLCCFISLTTVSPLRNV